MRIKVWQLGLSHSTRLQLDHAHVLCMTKEGPKAMAVVPEDKGIYIQVPELEMFDDPLTNPKLHRAEASFLQMDDPIVEYLRNPAGWMKDRLMKDLPLWFPDADLVHVLLRGGPMVMPHQTHDKMRDQQGFVVTMMAGFLTSTTEIVGELGVSPWGVLTEDLCQEVYTPPLPRIVTP